MGKQTFWRPSPLPETLTLPPSRPPSERNKKTPVQKCLRVLGKWGWEEGRNSESTADPGSRKEKVSPFSPLCPGEETDRWLLVQQAASSFLDRNV